MRSPGAERSHEAAGGSLWRDPAFNIFWAGQTLSTIGDAFTAVAFPLLIWETTHSMEKMIAITAYIAGGAVLAGLVAGPVVDRSDRRRLLLWSDLLRALLMAIIPAAAWGHVLSFPLLAAVAVGVGLLGNLSSVAWVAFVPALVSKARVTDANARLDATAAASFVVGPALAGFATQAWGPQTAIGIDAVSFLASFVSLLFVRGLAPAAPSSPGETRSLSAGLRFLWATPVLRTLTVMIGAEALLTAAALSLFTVHLKATLHETDARVGTMFAVASVGAVIGAALSSYAKRRVGIYATYIASAGLLAIAFAALPYAGSFAPTAAVAVAFSLCATMRAVLSRSRRQEVTPDWLIGRATAVVFLSSSLLRMIGASIVGYTADHYGTWLTCEALGAALLALMLLTIPAHSLRARS